MYLRHRTHASHSVLQMRMICGGEENGCNGGTSGEPPSIRNLYPRHKARQCERVRKSERVRRSEKVRMNPLRISITKLQPGH